MVVSEELLILASCLLRPMSRNSVLEEFSVRRLTSNQPVQRQAGHTHATQTVRKLADLMYSRVFILGQVLNILS